MDILQVDAVRSPKEEEAFLASTELVTTQMVLFSLLSLWPEFLQSPTFSVDCWVAAMIPASHNNVEAR